MGSKSPGLRASWFQSWAGPEDPVLCIWGPRLRACVQTQQPIRAHFTFRRATRSLPPGQLTADSGAAPPGRGAVIFSIATAQGSAGNSLLNTVSPGSLPFPASWEWWLPLEVALLAGEHCLPSAWEEGWAGGRSRLQQTDPL